MNIAYINCFAGASGDMILGALVDAGADIEQLRNELAKLNVEGWELSAEKIVSKGISGTRLHVKTEETHHHRGLNKIFDIIDGSTISDSAKLKSKKIFRRLGEAEAKIHNKDINEIHFHEVGALDSIVDIIGSVLALELLGIEKIYTSKFHIGTGTVNCAHGIIPVPAPATVELLKNAPVYSTGIESELLTPTGAAILTTLAGEFDKFPEMNISGTGYGFGTRELPISNYLRVVTGVNASQSQLDEVTVIETNIDDMNPEFYEYIMERLFEAGAKDVYMQQVIMKKNRPGIVLSVICTPVNIELMSSIIFSETTTLGIRISEIKKRRIVHRENVEVDTPWGKVLVKVKVNEGISVVCPEYEECKRIAKEFKLPIQTVFNRVKSIAEKNIES